MSDQRKLKLLLLFIIVVMGGVTWSAITADLAVSAATSAFVVGWVCALLLGVMTK